MKKKQFDPEDIHLVNVGVYKSNINVDFDVHELSEKFHAYQFCFSQKPALGVSDGAVRIRLNTTIVARDKNKKELNAKCEFDMDFHFQINDFSAYLSYTKDKTPQIDKQLGRSLLAISYSTARGIIFSKTEASVLSGILLPVIDPEYLLNDTYEIVSSF